MIVLRVLTSEGPEKVRQERGPLILEKTGGGRHVLRSC